MNARFTMATHILGMLAWAEREGMGTFTSERMASSIDTNPVVVRRIVGSLHRAGLVDTRRGPGGGVVLARRAREITLRQAYEAVAEGGELLGGYPSGPNPLCPLAPLVAEYLHGVYAQAEEALKARLDTITLDHMAEDLATRMHDQAPTAGSA